MSKTTKTKKPQTQRPKGPGAKQRPAKRPKSAPKESSAVESAPAPRRSGRERKPAPLPTDLVAPAAPRCGRDDCAVCSSNRASMQNKPCPNMAPAPRDDGADPRKLDKKGPHFKASDDIIEIMDALDGSAELEPPVRRALGCFKHSLDVSGRLDARWASLDGIHALDDYDVDDINADNNAQNAIEGAVRWVHFKGGSKPSVEEMGKMGPLEKRTVLRVLSYVASMQHRTKAQMKGRPPALGASLSDQARNAFVKLVEGGKWDGKHVCKALARKEDEPWPKYWQGAVDSASKTHTLRIDRRSGGAMRFVQLVNSLRLGAPQWACTAEMRAWFEARQCQYQRIMIVC